MSAEYQHCFAITDIDWLPSQDIDSFESSITTFLSHWNIEAVSVERRFDNKRLCRVAADSEWQERNQKIKTGLSSELQKEWRLDWSPADDTICTELHPGSENNIQWISLQSGPNFKIIEDQSGSFFNKIENKSFQCTACGLAIEQLDDPWFPRLLNGSTICQSVCNCGGKVNAASINFEPLDEVTTPKLIIWKAALFLDFGKEIPTFACQPIANRQFVNELENVFSAPIIEYGNWY